jgi:hypothetical protein
MNDQTSIAAEAIRPFIVGQSVFDAALAEGKSRREAHKLRKAEEDKHFPASQFTYNSRIWRRTSKAIRRERPICEVCHAAPSQIADHKTPWRIHGLPCDPTNLQAICRKCHEIKGCTRDGAFGNPALPAIVPDLPSADVALIRRYKIDRLKLYFLAMKGLRFRHAFAIANPKIIPKPGGKWGELTRAAIGQDVIICGDGEHLFRKSTNPFWRDKLKVGKSRVVPVSDLDLRSLPRTCLAPPPEVLERAAELNRIMELLAK